MIHDVIEQLNLQFSRAIITYQEIKNWHHWDMSLYEDTDLLKTIDAFIFRFIKIQDIFGTRLFRYYLDALGEYDDTYTLLDILDKLEKMSIIKSSDTWMNYRKLRNTLTHEYPDNKEEILDGIKLAMIAFDDMNNVFSIIKKDIIKRGI